MVTGADAVVYEASLSRTQRAVAEPATKPHGSPGSRVVLRILLVVVPVVLGGYALADRGFAYLASVPGTPLFAGELILLAGALFVTLTTGYLRAALRNSLPLALLLGFVAWGVMRTVPLISLYGVDSLRDAALYYYALMAVLVATLVIAVPDLPHRWARAYVPFLVVLLLWSPAAMLLAGATSPAIPWSGVALFSHKPGNTAVAAVTAIAFLWLVPTHSLSRAVRALLTGLGTVVILAVGTQNRGGLLAAGAALLLVGVLLGRRVASMAAVMVGTVVIGFVLAWGFNVHFQGAQGRDYSVAQLVQNATSITQGENSDLGGTVAFRDQLWSGALNLANNQGALITGLGFGPNLAQELGVSTDLSDPLRSPHNSHIDILARMGIVGAALWAGFWASWYTVMFRRLRGRSGFLSAEASGLVKVCMVAVAATLVNAYFDPTLEGPQVAIWLWTLAGLGLGIAARSAAPSKNATVAGTHP